MEKEVNLMHKAVYLLSIKDYSILEMKNKLLKYSSSEDEVNEVIDKLIQKKLLNDVLYAQEYYRFQLSNYHGSIWISKQLLQKGISETEVSQLVESYHEQEKEFARSYYQSMIDKNHKDMPTVFINKLKTKMYGRGYHFSLIDQVIDSDDIKVDTSNLIHKEYDKAKRMYQKYQGHELTQKITKRLLSKGFSYQDIKEINEEDGYND